MNKSLYLKIFFLFVLFGTTVPSFAEKKYRYIKREHGVSFMGDIGGIVAKTPTPTPTPTQSGVLEIVGNFKGAYAYNWKGWAEVGPYFSLNLGIYPFEFSNFQVGLTGQYNIIKNRGRRKLIPSVGLSAGVVGSKESTTPTMRWRLALAPHLSLKAFVAKRTAFVTNLGYQLLTPFQGMFRVDTDHNMFINMGFSYYFDFY